MQYLPGMAVIFPDGRRGRVIKYPYVSCSRPSGYPESCRMPDRCALDISDSATLGLLLVMVRDKATSEQREILESGFHLSDAETSQSLEALDETMWEASGLLLSGKHGEFVKFCTDFLFPVTDP